VIRARRAVVLAAVMLLPACGADLPDGVVGLTHTGCPPEESHGSGIEIEPGLVLTAAHVLKGADEIDPLGAPTPLAERADVREADVEGRTGVAYVVREGTVRAIPVAVRRMINLRTEDIYIDGEYDRPAWELDADTAAGDSGGAVVIDGRVIGVLSLRSNRYESRAYAIDPIRGGATIRDQLATGDLRAVDLTRCT
jgi:hypothetical protein